MRPGHASELYSTWFGGGVMQIDQGEPGAKVPPDIIASSGSGGVGCLTGPVSSSEASCLRPNTMTTRPSGSNLITMSEPLSVTQILSCGSTFTVWPNDQA